MALDTSDKRSSAVDVTIPWRSSLPFPNGIIAIGDMYQTGLMYRGISDASTGGEGGGGTFPSHHHFVFTFGRCRSQGGMDTSGGGGNPGAGVDNFLLNNGDDILLNSGDLILRN